MPRQDFEHHLQNLQEELLVLGSMVEKAIRPFHRRLKEPRPGMAHQVIADDELSTKNATKSRRMCIELIVTQQPMASDMRVIIAVLEYDRGPRTHR